jgi:hypothetical protein
MASPRIPDDTERASWYPPADLELLQSRLLAIGGVRVVLPLEVDPHLVLVAREGQLWGLLLKRTNGEANLCHDQSAALWWSTRGEAQIVTGWALHPRDGLWRPHSWCVEGQQIIETTPNTFLSYFGVALNAKEAFHMLAILGDRTVLRLAEKKAAPRAALAASGACRVGRVENVFQVAARPLPRPRR